MPNCVHTGWSRPSLRRMPSISSGEALSPAMIAAGSPGVRCSSKNTNSATTSITGMVASRRRKI